MQNIISRKLNLEANNAELMMLCGELDANLQYLEKYLSTSIQLRGSTFYLLGEPSNIAKTQAVLKQLLVKIRHDHVLPKEELALIMQSCSLLATELNEENLALAEKEILSINLIKLPKFTLRANNLNQQRYLERIAQHDINFGIGPAGTGKTYLAVACALRALHSNQVERIILVRPAVEAGEHLGFLPGDLTQKIDPYLRPLYDALYEMLGMEQVHRLLERNIIELAPLAYMRGRTLNQAFVILDESQNTTHTQMKMFLTRLGFGSKLVITGDVTQIDLAANVPCGLQHAIAVLKNIPAISFTFFDKGDVVRHPLIQQIIHAYEQHEQG